MDAPQNHLAANLIHIAASQKNEGAQKYILFLGSGRSGSTPFGAFLNMHPNLAISWEKRVLQKSLEKNRPLRKFQKEVLNDAKKTKANPDLFGGGRKTLSIWQQGGKEKWLSLNSLASSPSETLAWGDKKSGGNSELIYQNILSPWLIDSLSVIPIVTLRDPLDIFASKRRLGWDSTRSLEENWFALRVGHGVHKFPDVRALMVFYEQTCSDPSDAISRILDTFELPNNKNWFETGVSFLSRNHSRTDLKQMSGLSKQEVLILKEQREFYESLLHAN